MTNNKKGCILNAALFLCKIYIVMKKYHGKDYIEYKAYRDVGYLHSFCKYKAGGYAHPYTGHHSGNKYNRCGHIKG